MKKLILLSAVFVVVATSCNYIYKKFGIPDDNIVEELAEDLIEQKTGLDIDFTPNSKELK